MINGLIGSDAEMVFCLFLGWLRGWDSRVAMETKEQDVSHSGMVTPGCERHCFAISDTITQPRDKGQGTMVIWKSCRVGTCWLVQGGQTTLKAKQKLQKMWILKSKVQTNRQFIFFYLRLLSWYVLFQLCTQGSTNQWQPGVTLPLGYWPQLNSMTQHVHR